MNWVLDNRVFDDFANMAATVVERVIKSTPGPDSPLYWLMLGTLLVLLALLLVWLLIRLRRARLARRPVTKAEPDMTFEDVTAQAAAQQDEAPDHQAPNTGADGATARQVPAAAPAEVTQPAAGFRFFKRRSKADTDDVSSSDPDDDVILLGLEQEMLATRQLYLDGLISKEVYVAETRALYDKAQTRMT